MLQNISWSQYFTILLVATTLYYLFIWIVLFNACIPLLSWIGSVGPMSLHGEDAPDEMISTAQHVMDEIRPLFTNTHNKNELILALRLRLSTYAQWEEPGFRETILQFIQRESQSKRSIRLSEDDISALWK